MQQMQAISFVIRASGVKWRMCGAANTHCQSIRRADVDASYQRKLIFFVSF